MARVKRNIEAAIQRELVKWLRIQGLEAVWIRNEGKKSLLSAKLDKLSGCVAGFPDLIIFKQVRTITHILHLELKQEKGKLSESQKKWHAAFIPSGNRKLATGYGLLHCQQIVKDWVDSISIKQKPT